LIRGRGKFLEREADAPLRHPTLLPLIRRVKEEREL
jgi:hypothetical protein